MDSAGWVTIDHDVLNYFSIARAELDEIVATDNKSRFEVKGNKIRAAQGHSLPLNIDEMEESWEEYTSDVPVWHGTNLAVITSIKKEGLLPGARSHVHMAEELDSKVGKRAN